MSRPLSLLDDSDSDVEFSVNKNYADRYNVWRNKEELQKLKDLSKDVSDTSSESEDEPDPIIEKDFLKTLSLLKSKDPKIYTTNVEFFKEVQVGKKPKVKKEKPMFLKDYETQAALKTNGEFSDDEEFIPAKGPTFQEEEEEIKKSFKEALKDSDDESNDEGNLFQVRSKTKTQQDEEEADYMQWLKGHKKDLEHDSAQDMKFLKKVWNDPKLDDEEKFLRDYILNEGYKGGEKSNEIPTYHEIVDEIEDEKMVEQQELFEHKYNFRFEEPDIEFIKRYPRTVGDSLRRADNKRKMKRDEYAERKKKEKEQKREELKRLKALKRKEIEEKFLKLKEVSGKEEINFNEEDIESDFDPDKHDKKMKELFNDDYYTVEEVQKPEFEYDEELDAENWDQWTREQSDNNASIPSKPDSSEDEKGSEIEKNNDKLQFEKEMIDSTRGRKKGKKKSFFAKIISQPKPIFNPGGKSFDDYLEEYYKLDYEDIIGDLPVRFKYRKVVPNDFGLTRDEILAANDKELNRWCSVKKTCQYRRDEEELYDVQAFKKKSENVAVKQKILSSVYAQPNNDHTEQSVPKESGSVANQSKRRRKKKKKNSLPKTEEPQTSFRNKKESHSREEEELEIPLKNNEANSKKKRKRNQKGLVEENFYAVNNHLEDKTSIKKEKNTFSLDTAELENPTPEEETKNEVVRKKKNKRCKTDSSYIDAAINSPNTSDHVDASVQNPTNEGEHSIKNLTDSNMVGGPENFNKTENKKEQSLQALNNEDDSSEKDRSFSKKVNASLGTDDSHNLNPSKKKRNKRKKNKNEQAAFYKKLPNKEKFYGKHSSSNFKTRNLDNETVKKLALSNSRLAAFGINPKKFKNHLIYS